MFKDWFIMFHVELTTCSLLNPHQDGISDPCSPFPPGALKHRRHLFLQAPQGRSCLVHHVGLVRTTHATLAMWGLTENAFRWWFAHQSVGNLGFVDWGNCICVNWLICIYIYTYISMCFLFRSPKKTENLYVCFANEYLGTRFLVVCFVFQGEICKKTASWSYAMPIFASYVQVPPPHCVGASHHFAWRTVSVFVWHSLYDFKVWVNRPCFCNFPASRSQLHWFN